MSISIRWCGFDFGETIIDPSGNYQNWVELIKEIYTKKGRPDIINQKVARFDELIEQYDYEERLMDAVEDKIDFWKKYFRIKRLRETDMQRFLSYVLDDDPDVVAIFRERGFKYIRIADGLKECLEYLKEKGVSINVVADLAIEGAVKGLPNVLNAFGLSPYFSEIITNHGRIKNNGDIDLSYKGMEKIDGTIYKKLADDLRGMGIQPSQALIIGDRPVEDVEKSKENGFKAIQFVGIIKRRISAAADYVISDLRELTKIL